MGLWNKKGIIITAVSALAGLIVSNKLEEGLTNKFNPELRDAREDFKNGILEAVKGGHEEGAIFESTHSDIVETTAEEEVPE